MKVLLDTHIALWAVADSPRLTLKARNLILDADVVVVSVVSLWEIAIKHALKPRSMPVTAAAARRYFERAGYEILGVGLAHVLAVEALPAHHHDPFDRMLVAQSVAEPLRLLTQDRILANYGDSILMA